MYDENEIYEIRCENANLKKPIDGFNLGTTHEIIVNSIVSKLRLLRKIMYSKSRCIVAFDLIVPVSSYRLHRYRFSSRITFKCDVSSFLFYF